MKKQTVVVLARRRRRRHHLWFAQTVRNGPSLGEATAARGHHHSRQRALPLSGGSTTASGRQSVGQHSRQREPLLPQLAPPSPGGTAVTASTGGRYHRQGAPPQKRSPVRKEARVTRSPVHDFDLARKCRRSLLWSACSIGR